MICRLTWGYTKHYGGIDAIIDLVKKCHIGKGSYVLDVGCGVGATPCWLAKKYGFKIVGIDISESMIQRAEERRRRMKLEGLVEFKVADVQKLPFKTNTFDAVIGESILILVKDKKRALRECIRVVKPRGFVGFNEAIFTQAVPKKIMEYAREVAAIEACDFEGLRKLFKSSGLKQVTTKTHLLDMKEETLGRFKQYGWRDMLSAITTGIKLLFTDPSYLKVAREAFGTPWEIVSYWGYVIITGRK